MGQRGRRRVGFTLIEILAVVAIIAILVALILPAIQGARQAHYRAQCLNKLMQIGIALHNYESTYDVLPPGVVNASGPISNRAAGYHVSWAVQILPFVEQKATFNHFNFLAGAYGEPNATVRIARLDLFLCPSDFGFFGVDPAQANYAGGHHDVEAPIAADNKGVFYLNSRVRYEDVSDGTSNTIYVGEKRRDADLGWMSGTRATLRNTGTPLNGAISPTPTNPDPVGGFSSFHTGGAHALLGDGSVRFLKNTISPSVYRLLGNRMDGEMISSDVY